MTLILAGADIRGFYATLGIDIPGWAGLNARVRCFADTESHVHADRTPSCSVNTENGAYRCHGCGAKGGAYDAARTQGFSPRDAIDLMVAFGLTEYRTHRGADQRPSRPAGPIGKPDGQPPRARRLGRASERLPEWQRALMADHDLLARLQRSRRWSPTTMQALGLGLDHGRIAIPTRDQDGRLDGLLRYAPWSDSGPRKMVAAAGSRRTLLPHPTTERGPWILLVEGESDMIAARSHGLPAIAVPGAHGWRSAWARWFIGRHVSIVTDADLPGRELAREIQRDLRKVARARIIDLAPQRTDGYDLTDWLKENGDALR